MKKFFSYSILVIFSLILTACSNTTPAKKRVKTKPSKVQTYKTHKIESNKTVSLLQQQHSRWKGTRYRLGGTTKKGVDCSGFTLVTYRDLFGINLPRMTVDQARKGKKVAKNALKAGDLVFFNTGRGPNGKHVGIYVKDGQFLHASSKQGVTYSSLNSPYWSKAYWQARRL